MKYELVYVIRDEKGNYVSARQTEEGWYYVIYSGICTGFTCYKCSKRGKETADKDLVALKQLGNNFSLELVDLVLIPTGKRIDKEICNRRGAIL